MYAIRVPSLAENVNEATIGKWLVKHGDNVSPGDGVVELITEKAEFTLEAEQAGTVSARLAPEKSIMPVGSILLVLNATDDEIAQARKENDNQVRRHMDAPTVQIDLDNDEDLNRSPRARPGGGVRATPAARRLAREHGVDLEEIADNLHLKGAVKEEHVREYLDLD